MTRATVLLPLLWLGLCEDAAAFSRSRALQLKTRTTRGAAALRMAKDKEWTYNPYASTPVKGLAFEPPPAAKTRPAPTAPPAAPPAAPAAPPAAAAARASQAPVIGKTSYPGADKNFDKPSLKEEVTILEEEFSALRSAPAGVVVGGLLLGTLAPFIANRREAGISKTGDFYQAGSSVPSPKKKNQPAPARKQPPKKQPPKQKQQQQQQQQQQFKAPKVTLPTSLPKNLPKTEDLAAVGKAATQAAAKVKTGAATAGKTLGSASANAGKALGTATDALSKVKADDDIPPAQLAAAFLVPAAVLTVLSKSQVLKAGDDSAPPPLPEPVPVVAAAKLPEPPSTPPSAPEQPPSSPSDESSSSAAAAAKASAVGSSVSALSDSLSSAASTIKLPPVAEDIVGDIADKYAKAANVDGISKSFNSAFDKISKTPVPSVSIPDVSSLSVPPVDVSSLASGPVVDLVKGVPSDIVGKYAKVAANQEQLGQSFNSAFDKISKTPVPSVDVTAATSTLPALSQSSDAAAGSFARAFDKLGATNQGQALLDLASSRSTTDANAGAYFAALVVGGGIALKGRVSDRTLDPEDAAALEEEKRSLARALTVAPPRPKKPTAARPAAAAALKSAPATTPTPETDIEELEAEIAALEAKVGEEKSEPAPVAAPAKKEEEELVEEVMGEEEIEQLEAEIAALEAKVKDKKAFVVKTTKSVVPAKDSNAKGEEATAAAILGSIVGASLFGVAGLVAGGTVAAAAYIADRTRDLDEEE